MKTTFPKKRFGQNFLNDENILKKIASIISLKNQTIIEIGPGHGALTKYLVKEANEVISFEIDYNLYNKLKDQMIFDNLKIINQDFLKVDLSKFKDFSIVANIPYNISTDILFKIFENYHNVNNVVLLVQKEFGKRVCAKPNDSNYSKLAPSTKLFFDAKYCFDVDASCFWPKPKVTSCVIHLKRNEKQNDIDYYRMLEFIKICFAMRRKTLFNNIKNTYNISFEKFEYICKNLNKEIKSRPEEWSLDDLIFLYKNI